MSKAIADKIDIGSIVLPVTMEELNTLSGFLKQNGLEKPTHVTDVYKARRSQYNHLRIWSKCDLGTLYTKDLFVTDENYNLINMEVDEYLSEEHTAYNLKEVGDLSCLV